MDLESTGIPAAERSFANSAAREVLLDTLLQPVFDSIAAAASGVCGVPIALVSILEADRQRFKANASRPT